MWLDALAGILLAVFAAAGAWRGALASGLALAALVLAYAAAIVLGPLLGPGLGERLGAGPLLGLAVASTGAFFVAFAGVGLVGRWVRNAAAPPEGARDRFLGAVFGAVRGGCVVLLVVYLALWLEAARASGVMPSLPELGSSSAAAVTSELVESAVEAGLGSEEAGARVVAQLVARPAEAVTGLSALVESAPFAALQQDSMFWTYVESGNTDSALTRRSYLALQRDPELRGRLVSLGLVPEEARDDTRAFRAEMESVLEEIGPRLRAVRRDPALDELLEDPEVVAMLQSQDTVGLMGHPGFRALVDRAISQPVSR